MNVLIVGGTSGLGRQIADLAIARGDPVVIAGRRAGSLRPEFDTSAALVSYDVAKVGQNPDHAERAFQECADEADVIFWVAGNFLRKPFVECTVAEIDALLRTHVNGFVNGTLAIMKRRVTAQRPLRFVVVSSTASWKIQPLAAAYALVQGGKAHFTRNIAVELNRDLRGSQVTLVCPGGMKTEFFAGSNVDTSLFMDPAAVAREIWNAVAEQSAPYGELHLAQGDGKIDVSWGPKIPMTLKNG